MLPDNELADEASRRQVSGQIPAHIKDCIRRKFGDTDEAARIKHGYVHDVTSKRKVEMLYSRAKARADKMAEIRTPQKSCEEVNPSLEESKDEPGSD